MDATDAINIGELNGFGIENFASLFLLVANSADNSAIRAFETFSLLRLWLVWKSTFCRNGTVFFSSWSLAVLFPVLKLRLYSSGDPVAFESKSSTSDSRIEPSFF